MLDPYYQDSPLPVYTPAEEQFPANPAAMDPYGAPDNTRYHIMNPNGRFPGDAWMYSEFLRLYGTLDVDLIDRLPPEQKEKAQQTKKGMFWILEMLGTAPEMAMQLMGQFVQRYGTTTSPTNPAANPAYADSGPGVNYGPSGGFANGILDRGRATTGEYDQWGIPDDMGGGGGGGAGGEAQYTGGGGLPEWQGAPQSANFLGWQPDNPPSSPTQWVDAYTGQPSGPGGAQPATPPVPLGPGGPGVGAPPVGPGPTGPPGPYPPEVVALAEEFGLDLDTLSPEQVENLMAMVGEFGNRRSGGIGMRERQKGMRPGNTANLQPGNVDFGPDWSGAFNLPQILDRMNEHLGQQGIGPAAALTYGGTNVNGDEWGLTFPGNQNPENLPRVQGPGGMDPALYLQFLANRDQFTNSTQGGLGTLFGVQGGNPFEWVREAIEQLARRENVPGQHGAGGGGLADMLLQGIRNLPPEVLAELGQEPMRGGGDTRPLGLGRDYMMADDPRALMMGHGGGGGGQGWRQGLLSY